MSNDSSDVPRGAGGSDAANADATARFTAVPDPGSTAARASGPEVRLSSTDQATVDALRPGTALLLVLRGPNSGARYLLDDAEVSVGRHPSSDIFLDDVTVSRRHAVFRRTDDGFTVVDIGSLNGSYVNGSLVDSQDLQAGDEVMIGKFRLVYYGANDS